MQVVVRLGVVATIEGVVEVEIELARRQVHDIVTADIQRELRRVRQPITRRAGGVLYDPSCWYGRAEVRPWEAGEPGMKRFGGRRKPEGLRHLKAAIEVDSVELRRRTIIEIHKGAN